ncbi:hypothetical protein LQW54_000141 [Pestalotiopsis sp. IQ-011]
MHLSEDVETVLASLDAQGKDATSDPDADLTSVAIELLHGGILADAMGLGKTSSVLALIASTMQSANAYQPLQETELQERCSISGMRTRATLVIVTSAQILDSWNTEIQK